MHLIYIDDSYSRGYYCFSALAIPAETWRETFYAVKNWRSTLRANYGIPMYKEMHAVDLVAGRGRMSPSIISKWDRCQIYKDGLRALAAQEHVKIFNTCGSHSMQRSFERLLNRINVGMRKWSSHAILICDEGDEATYTRLARKLNIYNYVPSQFGLWSGGSASKNIPTERILEDPIFKESRKSYLIQMADFCAYSILQKERPIPSRKRYGLHQAYKIIQGLFVTQAYGKDPLGIIR